MNTWFEASPGRGCFFLLASELLVGGRLMGLWWSWRWWNTNGTEVLHSLKYLRWKLQMDRFKIIVGYHLPFQVPYFSQRLKKIHSKRMSPGNGKNIMWLQIHPCRVQVNIHPSPSEKLTAKRPVKINQRLEDEQSSNFGGKQVGPIFRFFSLWIVSFRGF